MGGIMAAGLHQTLLEQTTVPSDPLRAIFTPEVLLRLRQHSPQDYHLVHRLNVLEAAGPTPSEAETAHAITWRRVEKAAWEAYLQAAFACGLFDGESGAELRGRLMSPDYENFRSAIDECATAWLLAGVLRLKVTPRPGGTGSTRLEMRATYQGGEFSVEVKSPFRQLRLEPGVVHVGWGDDSGALVNCIQEAGKQFSKGCANVLVIVPRFMLRVATNRRMILNAFYGQDTIHIPVDRTDGEPVGEPYIGFQPDGRLLKVWRPEAKPRHTRVSAIVTVEEEIRDWETPAGRVEPVMHHDVLVAHNPYAEIPVCRSIWKDWPQLVHEGETLLWTDGGSLTGW